MSEVLSSLAAPTWLATLVLLWQGLLAPAFMLWGSPVTWLEILAFVLSLAMVVCNARINPIAWPLAMLASLLYAILFLDSRLYGEAGLQLVFIGAAAWGWWQWLNARGDDGAPLHVRRLSTRQWAAALLCVVLAWALLGLLLGRYTDSPVPWRDALLTAGSLLGQYLLARKWLDNWTTWLVVNVLSVGVFASQGLWLTSLLYALFAVMSVWGWRAWALHLRHRPGPATGAAALGAAR